MLMEALYSHLLDDLSRYLSKEQLVALSEGCSVDWYPDSTTKQVASVLLGLSFRKKYADSVSSEADNACLEKFLQVNNRVGCWYPQSQGSWMDQVYGEFKRTIYNFFYPNGQPLVSNFSQILDRGRMGPGASVGVSGNDFYTKLFSSTLSCTKESLYDIYVKHFSCDPLWNDAENQRQTVYGEAELCAGSRLSFVPKNDSISRSICIEPSLNMFYQLGLGAILEGRLRQFFGIDFAIQQERNRELARIGSMANTRSFVTIDLASASDSLSLRMLEEVIPTNILAWFLLLRSPVCELPNGASLELNMISTMGNGYTFPLQTMLFSSAALAVYSCLGIPFEKPKAGSLGNLGVFGDDIIVVPEAARLLVEFLSFLGFEVNSEKSFFEGPFRESCGGDYFRGQHVRGVYCKSLRTTQARFAVINQLNLWSARQGIYLPAAVGHLRSSVPNLMVPVWENDDAGIRCTSRNLRNLHYSKRYHSLVYRKWVPRDKKITIGDGIVNVPKGQKPRIYNPSGLLLSFLRGNIERGNISVRQRTVMYSKRTGVAPNWDVTPTGSALPADIQLHDFGHAVLVNS